MGEQEELEVAEHNMQMVEVNDLVPDPKNPRNNSGAISAVAESIRQFGFRVPIVVNGENEILAGHTRYRAAIMLGMDEVPCLIADDLTEDQQAAFAVAENRTSDFSFFDTEKLAEFVADIPEDLLVAFDVDAVLAPPEPDEDLGGSGKEPEKRQGLDLAPFEKYQYLTIICRTEFDYSNLLSRFELENPQKRYVDGVLKRGTSYGRVIEYPDFMQKLEEGDE